jgi:uncharacterized protein (TIGR03435 family)
LVQRHVNLVYSVALRQAGNPHHAEEIAQAVFIILARKASQLRHDQALASWLFQTTRLTAKNFLRSEARRQRREQEAYMESTSNEPAGETWPHLADLLDPAVESLGDKDRRAIVLRFYEGRNLREVGAALGASEPAAEMRVQRALEKLRKIYARRGVSLSLTAVAGLVAAHSVHAAPAGLGANISAVALTQGAAAGTSTLTLVKGALKIMAWTKAKTAVAVGVTLLLATSTATVAVPKIRHAYLEHKVVWAIDSRVLQKQPPVVLIRPAQPIPGVSSGGGGYIGGGPSSGKMIGLKTSVLTMLLLAYQDPTYAIRAHEDRIIVSAKLPEGEYDFIASTPTGQREALQQALKKQFGLVARREARDLEVLLLRVKIPGAAGLKPSDTTDGYSSVKQGKVSIRGGSLSLLADFIEDNLLRVPVIDETGLTNAYDLDLAWAVQERHWTLPTRPELDRSLLDQFGLELVPTNMPVEMLVIEKAK